MSEMNYPKPKPKNDIEKAMEKKEKSIETFQRSKENGIAISASGRDATLIVTSYAKQYEHLTEEELQKKIVEWRNWFYHTIYNTPFI